MKKFGFVIFILIAITFTNSCSKHYSLFHSKAKWMKDYFAEIKSGNYPNIYAISWWNEDWQNEDESYTYLRIQSSNRSQKKYKELISDDLFITKCSFSGKLIPVEGSIYHGAFPDFSGPEDVVTKERIDIFEEAAGKEIAWAYFSNNWMDSLIFPENHINIITSAGKTPFIRLMFRSVFEENTADPVYKLTDIINGRYDSAIVAWARAAKATGVNLLAEFGTEVNGEWFPWNGTYYGGGTLDNYGDPTYPDGPEIFRDAYRHFIDLCNSQNADNITWFFHLDDSVIPEEWWNEPSYYYPGDNYIDWIGISTYGPFQRGDEYIKPTELLQKAYKMMENVSTTKPYAILEFGITEL